MKKKWIISAGVVLTLGALVPVAMAERGQPMLRMLEHLDLTDEQREQLKELRETMATMREEQRESMMKILTDEQQATLKEMRGKRGKFFGRRGWGAKDRHDMRRGGKGAFSRLDLTDEQKEQLKELRQEHRAEISATRQKHRTALESVLTDEQRAKLGEMKDEAFYGGKHRHGRW